MASNIKQKVLWSGGFDSTYIVLKLISHRITVEPVYILQNLSWQKQARETAAMDRIRDMIPAELRYYLKDNTLVPIGEIRNGYKQEINNLHKLGIESGRDTSFQNPLLTAISSEISGLTSGICYDDPTAKQTKVVEYIKGKGIALPLIETSKQQMVKDANKIGISDILLSTWSCEGYDNDLTAQCGQCLPCELRIIPSVAFD